MSAVSYDWPLAPHQISFSTRQGDYYYQNDNNHEKQPPFTTTATTTSLPQLPLLNHPPPPSAAPSFQHRNNQSLVKPQLPLLNTSPAAQLPRRKHASTRPSLYRNAVPIPDYFIDASVSGSDSVSFQSFAFGAASTTVISPENPISIINTDRDALFSPRPTSHTRVRSLILPMSAAVASSGSRDSSGRDSPGSPPDLTDSKSSKSSSFHSCGLADTNPCDLSNFEDISLEEVAATHSANQTRQQNSNSAQFYRFSPHHTKAARDLTHSSTTRSLTNLTNGSSSAASNRGSKYQLPVPGPRTSRSKPRQSPQPFPHSESQSTSRSRSPSPSSAARTFSPPSMSLPTSHSSGRNTISQSQFYHRNRQSQHTRRKSVKELEREFDDLDDELPDDAIIYNVPISPRPPHERGSSITSLNITETMALPTSTLSQSSSRNNSGNSSPERRLERADTNVSANSEASGFVPSQSPLSPSLSDVSSEFPRSLTATKSRDAVLYDLNKDARELTEALEVYAEETEKKHEHAVQTGKITPSKVTPVSPTTTISKELPPIRKNDPLIDPLPVSREKEQFLTRTRPSWLPPKNLKEEKKHLKEYQRMMARAAEAEKKKARMTQKLQCERDAAAVERSKSWDSHVLPNWDTAIQEPRTKDLWWSGIPPHRRGEVWSRAVGNALGLSESSFDTALSRAKELQASLEGLSEEERFRNPLGYVFAGLKEDAVTVFPDLNLFQVGGPLHDSLLDVCMAFAVYRSNIEWDYGIMVSHPAMEPFDHRTNGSLDSCRFTSRQP
jgi:hypothetical protein